MSRKVLPFAPWHTPHEKWIGSGVYLTTIYGSHALAALIYGIYRVVRRREAFLVASGGGSDGE